MPQAQICGTYCLAEPHGPHELASGHGPEMIAGPRLRPMRIASRHLVLTNALTAVVCVLHALVHALSIEMGEWHDYVMYAFVAVSVTTSLLYSRQLPKGEPVVA